MKTEHANTNAGALFSYNSTACWYRHDPLMCLPGKYFAALNIDDKLRDFFGIPNSFLLAHAVIDDFGNLVRTA